VSAEAKNIDVFADKYQVKITKIDATGQEIITDTIDIPG